MAVDKKLLSRLKVLYVEDDNHIRGELSSLLSTFFGKVYSAANGREGLEIFLNHQNDIDVILSDINMPLLNGVDMVKKIREVNKKIPIMFATAYSDAEFLSEAIKLRIHEYIIKPIDLRHLLSIMNELANILYQEFLIEQQNKELEKYKDVIDQNNIVIKIDTVGKILYANNNLLEISKYDLSEVVGEPITFLKHQDTQNEMFDEMLFAINHNEAYKNKIKNINKDGEAFIVESYAIPTINDSGDIIGALLVQKDITSEVNRARELKISLMKDKGKIFLEGKETISELNAMVSDLSANVEQLQRSLKQSTLEKERLVYNIQKLEVDNRAMKAEIADLSKSNFSVEERNHAVLKFTKENTELRQKVKVQALEAKKALDDAHREYAQKIVNLDVKIDDLEKELADAKHKLSELGDTNAFMQKLEYWKEKAKDEAKRAEDLERRVMQHADSGFLKKIFGK